MITPQAEESLYWTKVLTNTFALAQMSPGLWRQRQAAEQHLSKRDSGAHGKYRFMPGYGSIPSSNRLIPALLA